MFLVNWSLSNSASTAIYRDFSNYTSLFITGLLIFAPLFFIWNEKSIKRNFINILIIIIILQTIIGYLHSKMLIQEYHILEFYTKIKNVFSARAIGTFGNPYDYGVFMIFSTFSCLYYLIKHN